jgi:hypothetical protein
MHRRVASLLTTAIIGAGVVWTPPHVARADVVISTECTTGSDTATLNRLISNQLADLAGFDTIRVIPLPDGRFVWTVQDAFIAQPDTRAGSLRVPTGFAHNALIVQDGSCFTTLHGAITPGDPCSVADASYVGADLTETCSHWFWPLSGWMDDHGRLAVFYVEMANELGSGATDGAHPLSVWIARFDAATLEPLSFAPAPASAGNVVYGAAVESDPSFSYLFGWSYDQFNLPDPTSPPPSQMFVARVPLGRFDQLPQYWNGSAWVANRAAAVPISATPNGASNPMQPRLIDGKWMSVVKVADWSGSAVRIDVAPAAQGPWTTVQTATVPSRTVDGRTNTYAAHLMPWRSSSGNLVVALSNNAWKMDPLALDNPSLYQPRLFELAAPPGMPSPQLAATTDPLGFTPANPPIRAMDTRTTARVAAGHTLRVPLAGVVAEGARAAVIDLAAVDPAADGYLTAWSCDEAMPPTSNLNYIAGTTRATHAVVTLAADASVCVYSQVDTDVLVDVTGSYSSAPTALGFHPQAPTRIYDSRLTGGPLQPGETRAIAVPANAAAVAANVTVTDPLGSGYLTVFPCQSTLPVVSNINYVAGQTVANLVQIGVSSSTICVFSLRRTNVVIDLQGTYDAAVDGLHYQAVAPTRLADTRLGLGTVFGRVAMDVGIGLSVLPANAPVATSMVPAGVKALMVSMIAVFPRSAGWAEIGPCVEPAFITPYQSSTLNFVAGDVIANQAITPTRATSGADVCTFATSPAFHVVDLTGWFV